MAKMGSRRSPLLRCYSVCTAIATIFGAYLAWGWLLAGTVYGLDPNKRVTQYSHKSWGIQDGSAPAGIGEIAQTSDGYLWFSSESQGLYRFDSVRFVPWALSANGQPITAIVDVYGHRAG